MHLVMMGLNHKTAPVELREKLSVSKTQLPEALAVLKALDAVSECLILSTCNRTEVYACTKARGDDPAIVGWLGELSGVSPDEFLPYMRSCTGHKVAEHLFSVASGIDSMVLGETQILGQVKEAYATASSSGATGLVLNNLFQQAATAGKRARTETNINRGAFSVGSAAVQLARSIFDELNNRVVLVVGAGEMAELMMSHLESSGVSGALVTNRTYEKAVELASEFNGRAVKFEDLTASLAAADIVLTSTAAKEPVIDHEMVTSAIRTRRGRPMFIIDIAVPRNVAQDVAKIDNVFLYDIDDLQAMVEADSANRQAEVEKVESIVAQETEEFMRWFRTLDAVPVITALREKFEDIRMTELEGLQRKLPHLSPEDMAAIGAATRSIMNRICHDPMIRIKEYANSKDSSSKLQIICEAFGISPSPKTRDQRPETRD